VTAWQETDDPVRLVVDTLAAAGATGGRLAVGDQLWSAFLLRLQDALPRAGFTVASTVTRRLRMRKDPEEVEALARVAAAIDQVIEHLGELRWAGRSEQELARDIEQAIRDTHDECCFVIVASGPNAASPHHVPTGRVVGPRDPGGGGGTGAEYRRRRCLYASARACPRAPTSAQARWAPAHHAAKHWRARAKAGRAPA
jgi:Xaa-Pro aminopeptidase